MSDLIACLSSGTGTQEYVKKLIEAEDWSKIFLVTDIKGFQCKKSVEFVIIDKKLKTKEIVKQIHEQIKGKVSFGDIAVNIISGSGKEHMAVLAACLKLGLGMRFVAMTSEGVLEL